MHVATDQKKAVVIRGLYEDELSMVTEAARLERQSRQAWMRGQVIAAAKRRLARSRAKKSKLASGA